MTTIIKETNVNGALSEALYYMADHAQIENSRIGQVLVAPNPVITEYGNSRQRVLFSPLRNANPFFHLMESLWMLSGRNDLAWPLFFNSGFKEYSDDGISLHGAYGYRWRNWFGKEQLMWIVKLLTEDPQSRRAVLSMWDPCSDLGRIGKDLPCNTHIYFSIHNGRLDMTVCCRSNDLWWGAYGANVVHFSILQEYLAGMIGVEMGVYRQFSNNFHLYTDVVNHSQLLTLSNDANEHDYYLLNGVIPTPLFTQDVSTLEWDFDLHTFFENPLDENDYRHRFFSCVAKPMYESWYERKTGSGTGLQYAEQIMADDWRIACTQWIRRAEEKKEKQEKQV